MKKACRTTEKFDRLFGYMNLWFFIRILFFNNYYTVLIFRRIYKPVSFFIIVDVKKNLFFLTFLMLFTCLYKYP